MNLLIIDSLGKPGVCRLESGQLAREVMSLDSRPIDAQSCDHMKHFLYTGDKRNLKLVVDEGASSQH